MKLRILALIPVFTIILFLGAVGAKGDTITLKSGATLEGVIKKVERGQVHVQVGNDETILDILTIESMDFNTPHLLSTAANAPVDHFMKNVEAQEIVRSMQDIEKAALDIRKKLDQVRGYWAAKQPIALEEKVAWDAAKEDFSKPTGLYQELLNDLYFHVLAKVDEYNALMREARSVYVGIKGVKVGSALVSKDLERLPLKKYVPGAWFDTIYYEGYNRGYDDGINNAKPDKH